MKLTPRNWLPGWAGMLALLGIDGRTTATAAGGDKGLTVGRTDKRAGAGAGLFSFQPEQALLHRSPPHSPSAAQPEAPKRV
jgi:hypothetical protein